MESVDKTHRVHAARGRLHAWARRTKTGHAHVTNARIVISTSKEDGPPGLAPGEQGLLVSSALFIIKTPPRAYTHEHWHQYWYRYSKCTSSLYGTGTGYVFKIHRISQLQLRCHPGPSKIPLIPHILPDEAHWLRLA